MKSDLTEGGLPSNLELTGNRLLLDQTLESTYSKEILFFKSVDELWFIKKSQNCIFKVNFRCQKSTEFFQKNLGLGQILCPKD